MSEVEQRTFVNSVMDAGSQEIKVTGSRCSCEPQRHLSSLCSKRRVEQS